MLSTAYLGCPGCLAASGMILDETSRRAAMMLVTASVLMSRVASKSWLAAVDRMARSLGRAPTLLELEISCNTIHCGVVHPLDIASTVCHHSPLCLCKLAPHCWKWGAPATQSANCVMAEWQYGRVAPHCFLSLTRYTTTRPVTCCQSHVRRLCSR